MVTGWTMETDQVSLSRDIPDMGRVYIDPLRPPFSKRWETIERLKRRIAHRADELCLDYQSADIKVVPDPSLGTVIFLHRYNPSLRVLWREGVPTVAVNSAGHPIWDHEYPLWLEYYAAQEGRGNMPELRARVIVRMPQLVFIILPDGTIQDGAQSSDDIQIAVLNHQHILCQEAVSTFKDMLHSRKESLTHELDSNPIRHV